MKAVKKMILEATTPEERNEVMKYICYECPKLGMTPDMITELMYFAKSQWN